MSQQNSPSVAVRNLQTYLRQLSYHDSAITAPPVDGILNSATQQSIRDFQVSRQLEPTGIADQLVWELIYAAYRASLAENTPPQRMEVFPLSPPNASFSLGDTGFPVTAIQFMLREAEANYGFLRNVEVSGTYTENTAEAVKAFQRQNGLRPNGIVDRITWNELTDQHNILFTSHAVE